MAKFKINTAKLGRKNIRLVLMLVGVVGLSYIMAQFMAPPAKVVEITKTKEIKVELPREEILIAAKDVDVGGVVGPDSFTWTSVLAENVSQGAITRSLQPDAQSAFNGWLVTISILQGEPVNVKKLLDRENSGVLSHLLPTGRRAITIGLTPDSSVNGFILPNDRIDLFTTAQTSRNKLEVKVISRNVRVIAIDKLLQPLEGQNNIQAGYFTLDVDENDIDVILEASAQGKITAVLRSAADHDDTNEVTVKRKKEIKEGISFFRAGRKETIVFSSSE